MSSTADIANIVVPEVQGFESVVVLQELNEKAWLGGGLTRVETHEKCCAGAGSLTMAGVWSLGVGILPRAYLQWP